MQRFIDVDGVEMVFETRKGSFHALREINLTSPRASSSR